MVRTGKPEGLLFAQRLLPPEALVPWVHHFWWLRWDLRTPFSAEALSYPAARIVLTTATGDSRAVVEGVFTARRSKTRIARGDEFGIQFRPVAFQGLLRGAMSKVRDQVVPLGRLLGRAGVAWAEQVFAAIDVEEKIALATTFLAERLEPLTPEVVALRDLVEQLATDRSLLRVEDVGLRLGLDTRALQRRFLRYVGVSPKGVLRRYRLLDAAEQLKAPSAPTLASLAASLGYADQAHFARDFKKVVGRTPGAFQRGSS